MFYFRSHSCFCQRQAVLAGPYRHAEAAFDLVPRRGPRFRRQHWTRFHRHLLGERHERQRSSEPRAGPRQGQASDRRRRRTLGRVSAGLRREDAQGRRRQGGRRLSGAAGRRRGAEDDPGRADRAAHRAAQFLEPPGRKHARPGDRDDAEAALRAPRRDRHRLRRHLPDRRAAGCRASRTTRRGAP